ncbi:MAG: succinate dehydrogenase, hydrophobic membrane anchor protein [Thalassobaculales bacterium]
MAMRSMMGRVRGLGSAKEGVEHWWQQRLTAVALVPLLLWFVAGVIAAAGGDHAAVAAWIGNPVTAVLLLLLIGSGFLHGMLGLQVVIEDYIHGEGLKLALLVAVKFAGWGLGLASAFAVLKIAFGK